MANLQDNFEFEVASDSQDEHLQVGTHVSIKEEIIEEEKHLQKTPDQQNTGSGIFEFATEEKTPLNQIDRENDSSINEYGAQNIETLAHDSQEIEDDLGQHLETETPMESDQP